MESAMLQFYFLSILLNLICGSILLFGKNLVTGEYSHNTNKILGDNAFFDDKTFRIVLASLSVFVGIMKLLSVVKDDIPVIGDFFASLAGFLGGVCLLLEYYKIQSGENARLPSLIENIFITRRTFIGWFCMIAALLHFVFPEALLL